MLMFIIPTVAVVVILAVVVIVLAVIRGRIRSDKKSGREPNRRKKGKVDAEIGHIAQHEEQRQAQAEVKVTEESPTVARVSLSLEQQPRPASVMEKSELSFSNLLSSTPHQSIPEPEKQPIVHDSYTFTSTSNAKIISAESELSRRFSFTLPYQELKAMYADTQIADRREQQEDRIERALSFMVPVSELKGNALPIQPPLQPQGPAQPIPNESGAKARYDPLLSISSQGSSSTPGVDSLSMERNEIMDPQGISSWSVSRVSTALISAGLNRGLVEILRARDVDGQKLLTLDHITLDAMGIDNFEARQLLLVAVTMIKERNDDSQPPKYS
ncbi:hypothetical protein HDU97_005641 [Phlyctochytrium planicorne]|nr:hypothetical protein HDU97_005641 [Phlyctochytrium planicorne]